MRDTLYGFLGRFVIKTRSTRRATIINYHNPAPAVFRQHMELLSKWFSFISIDSILSGDFGPSSLLVTLDDGNKGNHHLKGTICRYSIPAVIYVVAGCVDTSRKLWFDVLPHDSDLMRGLKKTSDEQRIRILKEIYEYSEDLEFSERSVLNSSELRDLQEAGCTIGSHSISHPVLTRCSPGKALSELIGSRELLSDLMGVSVDHFAYPAGYWNRDLAQAARKAGYMTARTTIPGKFHYGHDPFALPCFGVADKAGPGKALLQASGLWGTFRRVLKPVVNSRS